MLGSCPAAIRAIIVSPIPRETPSTIAATMPERAAGKTTRVEVWSFEEPSPNDPSRSEPGTADIASSETEAIVGTIMIPITRPAESALKTCTSRPRRSCRIVGVTKVSAKKPSTTVGTPTSTSSTGLITCRVRGLAYSER